MPLKPLRERIAYELSMTVYNRMDGRAEDYIMDRLPHNKEYINHLIQSGAVGIDVEALEEILRTKKYSANPADWRFTEQAKAISAQGAKILKACLE